MELPSTPESELARLKAYKEELEELYLRLSSVYVDVLVNSLSTEHDSLMSENSNTTYTSLLQSFSDKRDNAIEHATILLQLKLHEIDTVFQYETWNRTLAFIDQKRSCRETMLRNLAGAEAKLRHGHDICRLSAYANLLHGTYSSTLPRRDFIEPMNSRDVVEEIKILNSKPFLDPLHDEADMSHITLQSPENKLDLLADYIDEHFDDLWIKKKRIRRVKLPMSEEEAAGIILTCTHGKLLELSSRAAQAAYIPPPRPLFASPYPFSSIQPMVSSHSVYPNGYSARYDPSAWRNFQQPWRPFMDPLTRSRGGKRIYND